MTADNIQNVRSLLFGSIITLSFFGVLLIIHTTFIMFYALEDTSENLHKFGVGIILKMPGNNKFSTPLKQFFNLTVYTTLN